MLQVVLHNTTRNASFNVFCSLVCKFKFVCHVLLFVRNMAKSKELKGRDHFLSLNNEKDIKKKKTAKALNVPRDIVASTTDLKLKAQWLHKLSVAEKRCHQML